MTNFFDGFVSALSDIGFFGYFLPFIFVFATTYGVLTKSKAIGTDEKVIGIVSLAIGFTVMAFGGNFLQSVFVSFSGILSILILAGIIIVIFFNVLGGETSSILGNESMKIAAILVAVGAILLTSQSVFRINILNDGIIFSTIIILVVLGIVYYIIKN